MYLMRYEGVYDNLGVESRPGAVPPQTLMRLLLDRGASPLAIRNAHRVTDDARTILRQYYSVVVHLNAFGTTSSCPSPARLAAIDLVPTIASYVI